MKAFWWFKEHSIAGMARPGFNNIHWFDLSFEEVMVYGWLGQRSSDSVPVHSLREHVRNYGAKILSFHGIDQQAFQRVQENFEYPEQILNIFDRVAQKTKTLEQCEIVNDCITFRLCSKRLEDEVDFLKKHRINTIVSLTEQHHQKEDLQSHFELHHLAIEDLNAPRLEQVVHLADLIQNAQANGTKLAVHCMAGIGRTSTMLTAAHLVLGENFESLKERLARQNPFFKLTGPQADFLHSVAERVET